MRQESNEGEILSRDRQMAAAELALCFPFYFLFPIPIPSDFLILFLMQ